MRDAVKTKLSGDTTLSTTLPGGVYAGTEITRQHAPGAFDANGEIQPCGLVTIENQPQHGPFTGAEISVRTYIVIYVYQRRGYASIDAALARIRALLHDTRLGTGTWQIAWAFDSGDLSDEGLQCAMRFSRFVATRLLK